MLDCQESGHWWPTRNKSHGSWVLEQNKYRQKVYVRRQSCERGCGRVRKMQMGFRSFELIGKPTYSWSKKAVTTGFKYKSDMRRAQVGR